MELWVQGLGTVFARGCSDENRLVFTVFNKTGPARLQKLTVFQKTEVGTVAEMVYRPIIPV
jgi:hypothetical protein